MSSFFSFNIKSPPRKPIILPSATSPFCTSPSQLQEVTLDNDGTFCGSMGLRSPNGPLRGRSVKEFEEQLTNLRKENFNLKLRIYFLEERMGTNFNLDKENAVKQNIELLVEVESLRKEIQEKQELLCQAVKAMELEEEEHKKDVDTKNDELAELQQQLEELRLKAENFQDASSRQQLNEQGEVFFQAFDIPDKNAELVKDLQAKVEELEHELLKEKDTNLDLEKQLKVLENKNKLAINLEAELKQKDEKLRSLVNELETKTKLSTGNSSKVKALQEQLEERTSQFNLKNSELKRKETDLKKKSLELDELRKQLNETRNALESDQQRKTEKHKPMSTQRQNRLTELESLTEKQKARIMYLEAMLEQAQSEVKRKSDELQSLRSPVRRQKSTITDVDSFLVSSASSNTEGIYKKTPVGSPLKTASNSSTPSLLSPGKSRMRAEEDKALVLYQKNSDSEKSRDLLELNLDKSKKHILKLEKDQVRACKIIQSMLETRKEHLKQISDLEVQLQNKNKEISEIQNRAGKDESVKSTQGKVSDLNVSGLQNQQSDTENTMAESEEDTNQLLAQYKELTSELDKQKQILISTLKEKDNQMHKLQEQYNIVVNELKIKEGQIIDLQFELIAHKEENKDISLTEKKDFGTEKGSWLHELEEKDKEIERLELELRKRTCDLQSVVNNELWEKNREIEKMQNRYGSIAEAKETEILRLKNELSGKDLQLQVLKEKISELGVHISTSLLSPPQKRESSASDDIKSLQEQLKCCLDDRKKLPDKDQSLYMQQLKQECKDLQEELEKSEKLRQETNEICSVLSTRLEELVYFLDSLLKQKTVLGFLGNKQNSRLRQYLDETLDLSRTLTVSMTLNPDQSLLQLSNISGLLNASRHTNLHDILPQDEENNSILSIVPSNVTLTYQSHLSRVPSDNAATEQAQIIKVLREQVENLKREVEIRDVELGKKLVENDEEFVDAVMDLATNKAQNSALKSPQTILMNLIDDKNKAMTSTTLKYRTDNQSESESWSEPDRNVSLARIGLTESIRPQSGGAISRHRSINASTTTESTEEECCSNTTKGSKKSQYSESKQTVLNLSKQVTELENRLKDKETQLLATEVAYYESDSLLKKERKRLEEAKNQTEQLQCTIKNMEERLQSIESSKVEAQSKIADMQKIIEELHKAKENLLDSMDVKDKDIQNRINRLEQEKNEAIKFSKASEEKVKTMERVLEEMVEGTRKDMEAAEEKIANLEVEKQRVGELIQEEERHKYNARMEALEAECESKIRAMKLKTEEQIEKLSEAASLLQAKYESEYVKRTEVEKLRITIQDLESVREKFKLTEDRMLQMEEHEIELKKRLHDLERDHRDKLNNLRKELDNATLQYSEAMLEKTKLINEKAALEKQIKDFSSKERDFIKQVNEFQSDFSSMKESFQKRVAHLEQQKANLEIRISELEVANAEMRSKLIKVQCGQTGDQSYSSSAPNPPSRFMDALVHRSNTNQIVQYNQDNHSGYTSEDIAEDVANAARRNANSSPDLGIESDHGRFSSLEAHLNVARPFLQPLEITESMNNLLEAENQFCNNEECSKKTRQIVNENTELKKRLSRTRHALEETVTQLSLANQRKKQVEKTICKQIHKTSQVLRKAKANLDSGSETDIVRK